MNMSVKNGVVNGDYWYMNSSTQYVTNSKDTIDYTKERDAIYTNICLRWKNEFPDGLDIDYMLCACAPNHYVNMK